MTTIITKNGSGAPTAGQLTTGELAVDLTNKELYTKDSGGNVIKVGAQGGSTGTFTDLTATSSFTSPGIDDNANATAITIDASENVGIGTTDPSSGTSAYYNNLVIKDTGVGAGLTIQANPTNGFGGVDFRNTSGTQVGKMFADMSSGTLGLETAGVSRMNITSAGNVGIGTSAPSVDFEVNGIAKINDYLSLNDNGYIRGEYAGELRFQGGSTATTFYDSTNITERMRINASGHLGIGEANPVEALTVINGTMAASNTTTPLTTPSHLLLTGIGNGDGFINIDMGSQTNSTPYARISTEIDNAAGSTLLFHTSNNFGAMPTERMRIDESGNVGIGTTSPVTAVEVEGSETELMRLSSTSGNGGGVVGVGSLGLDFFSGSTHPAVLLSARESGIATYLSQFAISLRASNADTAPTERFRINSLGNVGIGTASPTSKMVVEVGDNAPAASGTMNTGVVLQSGPASSALNMGSDNSGGYSWINAAYANNSSIASPLVLMTGAQERMRIDTSGNLLVGRTSPVAGAKFGLDYTNGITAGLAIKDTKTTGTGVVLHVVNGSGTIVGGISQDQSNTTFSPSSDVRLKENIRDYDSALGDVMKLKPRKYSWKANGKEDSGFIAQELLETPEFANRVTSLGYDKDSMYGVDYMKFVTVLTGAIQEQQAMIETLQAEVAALKGA